MEDLIQKLKETMDQKDKRIAELEKALTEKGGIHYHTHYDKPCSRQHYPSYPYQGYPGYWYTNISNGNYNGVNSSTAGSIYGSASNTNTGANILGSGGAQ